jgi:ABC-type transporter Mla subunit MlaD
MSAQIEIGLRQVFGPIALECDTRLHAVISAQEALIVQLGQLDATLDHVGKLDNDLLDLERYTKLIKRSQERLQALTVRIHAISSRVQNIQRTIDGQARIDPTTAKVTENLASISEQLAPSLTSAKATAKATSSVLAKTATTAAVDVGRKLSGFMSSARAVMTQPTHTSPQSTTSTTTTITPEATTPTLLTMRYVDDQWLLADDASPPAAAGASDDRRDLTVAL